MDEIYLIRFLFTDKDQLDCIYVALILIILTVLHLFLNCWILKWSKREMEWKS